jgi:anti-sigma regulatory factor (Ser/Thr protein kinase)
MSAVSYTIKGGDFENDGAASRCVKEQLKKVGADPAVVRRAMVAAYEAEMNVVIHAHHGELRATLQDGRLDVEVADEGPGIPDIELAMAPGYSTASADARQLGFGAGMGLPNINKNADRFSIESTAGKGTTVRFTILLKPQALYGIGSHSLRIAGEKCRLCLGCIHACPTQALRVFRGKPEVLDYLCIDCGACIAACPADAFTIEGAPAPSREEAAGEAAALRGTENDVLIVPSPCLAQFGANVTPGQVLAELAALGFGEVRVTEPWEAALRAAVLAYAKTAGDMRSPPRAPVISPVCPAVVNLIETRFPALLPNVAPFESPMAAAHADLGGRRVPSIILCPAHRSVLAANESLVKPEILVPSMLRAAVIPRLRPAAGLAARALVSSPAPADEEASAKLAARIETALEHESGLLRVAGLPHVIGVLEAIEDGLVGDVMVLEPYACDGRCFGSPLLAEDPFLAAFRWRLSWGSTKAVGQALRLSKARSPRRGLRLDADMAKAITKLARIDKLARSLPGSNCGMCGAPTCAALAEDIVLGRATREACLRERLDAEAPNQTAGGGRGHDRGEESMKLGQVVEKLGLECLTPELGTDSVEVTAGYASDLLSDVLANAPRGGVLITVQVHLNVVAVAVHAELAAVVFAMDRRPDEAVRKKAVDEGIHLFVCKAPTFEVVGRLYELGLRGLHA